MAIVVADNAEHEPGRPFAPDRPLGMKLVAALVVGLGILEVERHTDSPVKLQLVRFVRLNLSVNLIQA